MAHQVSMKALFVRLGTNQETATHIVDYEGYNDMSKLSQLTTKDVDALCKNIRQPGGLTAQGNQNRGHTLSNRFQKLLHQAVFYIKTKRRVSREVLAGGIEENIIDTRLLNLRRDKEADYTNPTQVKVEISKQDWPKTFNMLEQALGTIKGIDGTPLSYCMRETAEVVAEASDPPANYSDSDPNTEMKARAPIMNAAGNYSDTFTMDNPTVWDQVRFTFENTEEWTHIRTFMRKEDGRGAILKLRSVKMGTQFVQNQSGEIERKHRELTWKGDTRGWKFENYATKHQHYFNLLKELDGYHEPNEGTRVRMLMDGITTDKLDACKNTIYASDSLRQDFDGAVAQFTNFLGGMPKSGAEKEQRRNASELGSKTKVQHRFYTKEEYSKLSKEDRRTLWELREGSTKGGSENKGKRTNYDKSFKEQNKIIKKQGRQIAKLMSRHDDDEDATAAASSAESEVTSNRTNPALRRRRGNRDSGSDA
jgi:hypothetical protein